MKSKIIPQLPVDYKSIIPEDYVPILNIFSAEIGAVKDLGIFADDIKVSHGVILGVKESENFIRTVVCPEIQEQPDEILENDNMPTDPNELTFEYLLKSAEHGMCDPIDTKFHDWSEEQDSNEDDDDEDDDEDEDDEDYSYNEDDEDDDEDDEDVIDKAINKLDKAVDNFLRI